MDDPWPTEKAFWLDGAGFYRDNLAPDAVMVFPEPVGILSGEAIIAALEGAARWDAVEITQRGALRSGETLILTYHATGQRGDAAPYRALCSSTYGRVGSRWLLLCHQQTPVG
ncbi:MAG: nuclear transport factor 2 family protein [Paracoccus sp. (in: a-proteobacteria)]|nr:nuclear transport factor 2 family protein [Paracoccus sp. (in: a-proteobacteria)]